MQDQTQQVNPKKLFVGNLPYAVGEEDLRQLFSDHGEIVDLRLILDRATGRSKGIAFVEFNTEEEAQKAIDALNGHEIDGRALVVNVARPREERPRTGGFNRGGGDRRFSRGGYNNRGGDRNNNRY